MSETEVLKVKEGNDKPSEATESKNDLQTESEDLRESNTVTDSKDDTSKELVPALEIVEDKPLTGEEKERAGFVQDQVISLFKATQPRPEGLSDEEYNKHVEEKIEAIKKEKEEGIYGPATKEAFKNTVTWLENQAIPGSIAELHRLELPIPANSPLNLPPSLHNKNRIMTVDLFKEMAANGHLKPDLNISTDELPKDSELDKFSDSLLWLKEVDKRATTARNEQIDRILENDIKRLISDPEKQQAWLDRRDSKPEEWRQAAIKAVDLATRVRNYTEAMDSLNRAGKRFGFSKPPGSEIIRDDKDRIKQVKLDLPKDLRLDHPENAKKIRELEQWMKDHGEEVDQAIKELIKLESEPDRLLYWGEVDMPTTAVKLDRTGNISDFVDPENRTGNEQTVNLVDLEFDVNEVKDENGKTKIVVSNDVQYRNSKWYNYLNLGAESVGNEINVPSREYDPEDWVPVRNGGKVEIMKAKDLASWKLRRQTFHYGEKVLIATLDASMLVTGAIAVGGAVKAARAGQLVLSQAMKQGAKGALRATVGASGIVNNAYFQNTDMGRKIQTARGLYFVGEAAIGLGAGGWRLAKSLRGASETAAAGKSAAAIVESQIEATKWANRIYKPAEVAASATMYPFAAIIGLDIHHQLDGLNEIGRNDPTRAALRQAKDGRGDHAPETREEAKTSPEQLKSAELDRYGALLSSDSTKPEVKEIIEQTKKLIEEKASAKEIEAYKEKLIANFMPGADYVVAAEKNHSFYSKKSNRYMDFQESQSRDVQTAAALALLQLSRAEDGSIPETLATRSIDIPEYKYEVEVFDEYSGGTTKETKTKPARVESQDIKTSDITAFLRREIESPKSESRLVASSDLALQLGIASGREVAGVLQDVVSSDKSTNLEKTEAVLRLGVTVDALKIQESVELSIEEQTKEDSKKVGLSSDAIKAYLKTLSSKGDSENVRAAAALMSFANGEADSNERQSLMKSYAKLLGQNAETPEAFAKKAIETLQEEIASDDTSGQRKLNAAEAILEFTKGGGDTVKANPELKATTYDAIGKVISSDDVALSSRAIRMLTPEGLQSISTSNKELAKEIRNNTVEIVRNLVDEVNKNVLDSKAINDRVDFLSVIKPVVIGGDQLQKSTVELSLIKLFDSEAGNDYADFSPELRKAAINTISDLGSRGALTKIRETLAGDKSKGIEKDWDASVRYEALKALERMNDPKLRSTVLSLIRTENDPLVSAHLADVKFTQERMDPTSEEYQKEYERTKEALIRDPFEGWDELKTEMEAFKKSLPAHKRGNARQLFVRKFMDDNYWLLNGDEYKDYYNKEGSRAADAAFSGVRGWINENINPFQSSDSIVKIKRHARITRQNEIFDKRGRQFDQLIRDAGLKNLKGMKAKMALADILHSNGEFFTNADSAWAQNRAAKAMIDLSKPGVENRDFVVWTIKTGLTTTPAMNKYARQGLFIAMRDNLAKPDSKGHRAMSREEVAITAAEALKLQHNQRVYDQDNDLKVALINTITENGHHRIYPVFEAMAESSKDPKVKASAQAALTWMRDSVMKSFIDTSIDHTSTPAQSALNIEKAMQDGNNSQEVIDSIFAATKLARMRRYRLPDNSRFIVDDPRIDILEVAMNSKNEKVRLAAAGGLLHMLHYNGLNSSNASIDLSKARSILDAIQKESSVERLKAEARQFNSLARPVVPAR